MMAKLSSARSCGHWSIGKAPTNEEARKPWFSKIGRKSRVRIIHKCLGMPMKYHGSGEPPLTVPGGILLTLDSGLLFLGWEWTWGALKSGIGLEMSFTTSGTVFDSSSFGCGGLSTSLSFRTITFSNSALIFPPLPVWSCPFLCSSYASSLCTVFLFRSMYFSLNDFRVTYSSYDMRTFWDDILLLVKQEIKEAWIEGTELFQVSNLTVPISVNFFQCIFLRLHFVQNNYFASPLDSLKMNAFQWDFSVSNIMENFDQHVALKGICSI